MNHLTQQHRASQLLLRRATIAQLGHLWPALDWKRLDATFPAFAVQVGAMVQTNRATSAGLASQYVRALRKASGIPGEFRSILPASLNVDQFTASLRINSLVALKKSAADGRTPDIALPLARTVTAGAMAKLVLDAGRETVTQTSVADPAAVGWQRVGDGAACDFCSMLLGRGAVYSEESASFESHGHCGCTAEPVFT